MERMTRVCLDSRIHGIRDRKLPQGLITQRQPTVLEPRVLYSVILHISIAKGRNLICSMT